MKGTVFRNRMRNFLRQNGAYVLGMHFRNVFFGALRNHLLAGKFGVEKIHIGERSYLRGLSSIQMGRDFSAADSLWLHAVTEYADQRFSPTIVIGDHVRVSQWVHIAATHYVEIGDNVLIGSKVIITDHNHGQYSREHTSPQIPPSMRPLDRDRKVIIGKNVWLGDGVVVAPGASIGEGSVIGANSVVTGSIPPFVIAAGAPARVIKTYDFSNQQWVSIE
jgi:lipopolysaccharide O-acetyltransferase